MKKAKKLTALVLAMMMSLSIMAVTASAYGAEEHAHTCYADTIQPRIPAARCPQCDKPMVAIKTAYDKYDRLYTELQCQNSACSYYGQSDIFYW